MNNVFMLSQQSLNLGIVRHFTTTVHCGVEFHYTIWYYHANQKLSQAVGGFAIRGSIPHHACGVVDDEEVSGLPIDSMDLRQPLEILLTLNNETNIHLNALTNYSGVYMCVCTCVVRTLGEYEHITIAVRATSLRGLGGLLFGRPLI
jgi:hypothetical protein